MDKVFWFIAGALVASVIWLIIINTGTETLLNELLGAR